MNGKETAVETRFFFHGFTENAFRLLSEVGKASYLQQRRFINQRQDL